MNRGDILECRVDKPNRTFSFWRDNEELSGGYTLPEVPFVFAVLLYIVDQSVEIM